MILRAGTPSLVFFIFVFGGLLSLAGALTYAELAAALPKAGGEYAYLREAYGPLWGFLYSWTQMWGCKEWIYRNSRHRFFCLFSEFLPNSRKSVFSHPFSYCAPWSSRRPFRPIVRNSADFVARRSELFRRPAGRKRSACCNRHKGVAICWNYRRGSAFRSSSRSQSSGSGYDHGWFLRGAGSSIMGVRRLEQRQHGRLRDPESPAQSAAGIDWRNRCRDCDLPGGQLGVFSHVLTAAEGSQPTPEWPGK